MRNGNLIISDVDFNGNLSSYRTYEEWKPIIFVIQIKFKVIVLTVPMRNGNPG